jgi:hypothetical protein
MGGATSFYARTLPAVGSASQSSRQASASRYLQWPGGSIASPAASNGVATASPATGTMRATSAVALNGSATAPHPAKDVQISKRAKTRIGPFPSMAGEKAVIPIERDHRISVPRRGGRPAIRAGERLCRMDDKGFASITWPPIVASSVPTGRSAERWSRARCRPPLLFEPR